MNMNELNLLRNQLKKATKGNRKLNAKGRKQFPIVVLDSIGIDSYEKLQGEMMLIEQKQSRRSASQRRAIVRVFFNVELLKEVPKVKP